MYLTLHADTAGGIVQRNNASRWSLPRRDFRPRWRSMVTSLSPTGLDLTNDEFLEFWLFQPAGEPADSAGVRLVFDLGTVSEDALAIAPDSFTVNGARHRVHRAAVRRPRDGSNTERTEHRHLQRRDRRHRHPGRPARFDPGGRAAAGRGPAALRRAP